MAAILNDPGAVLQEEVLVPTRKKGFGIAAYVAIGWLALVAILALFASYLPGIGDPYANVAAIARKGPFSVGGHPLGGDVLGRDMLARIAYGAQHSLAISFGAVFMGFIIGGLLGMIAGYVGGRLDSVLTAIMDILLAFPALVLALTLVIFLKGQSVGPFDFSAQWVLVVALGLVSIPLLGRITRANTLSWAQREFVLASKAQGATTSRILFREILPNVLPSMLAIALLGIGVAMIAEAGLAVLGVGTPLPTPSWGNMIADGRSNLSDAPHIVFIPSFMIFFSVLALNYLGDVIRDHFDVRESALWSNDKPTSTDTSDGAGGPLLRVEDLHTRFSSDRGTVHAVRGVSLKLERGKTLGIVGESGSGKSVLSRSIMGLLPNNARRDGGVFFEGSDISDLSGSTMRAFWGSKMSMVFQDPMTALNPVLRIGNQITESIHQHLDVTKEFANETALSLLKSVGIPEPERRLREYPHQMSGGMRQRVMIAIAMACGPKLLLADEPTTALDVTVQAQILDLLQEQQRERFMAMILVTHDLGVVAGRADDIAVMYAGAIVEKAPTSTLFREMSHPYTEALLKSIPKLEQPSHTRLEAIAGRPPDLVDPPPGCKFAPRCPYAQERCHQEEPKLEEHGTPGHEYACFYPVGSPEGAEALARNQAKAANANPATAGASA